MIVKNRTKKYLIYLLYNYEELSKHLNSICVNGIYINKEKNNKPCFFIEIDTKKTTRIKLGFFENFLKSKKYFVGKYCPDADIFRSNRIIYMISFPENKKESYDYFLTGEYSLLYDKKELKNIYSIITKNKPELLVDYYILAKIKNNVSVNNFINIIKEEFDTTITEEDITEQELDIKPKLINEILY